MKTTKWTIALFAIKKVLFSEFSEEVFKVVNQSFSFYGNCPPVWNDDLFCQVKFQ